jgi:hypothetical protein
MPRARELRPTQARARGIPNQQCKRHGGRTGTQILQLEFEYKFFDRYNWDGGKSVTLFGVTITDEFMARFHREGLAKEFDMYGSTKKP